MFDPWGNEYDNYGGQYDSDSFSGRDHPGPVIGERRSGTGSLTPPPPPALVPATTSTTTPEGDSPRGGGGGGGDYGSIHFNFAAAPKFAYDPFHAPSVEEARAEPGYEFRAGQGRDALEHSAAARGSLLTGGTLKDLIEYGQNFAAQEYNNVFNRALQAYDRRYTGQRDAFAPRLAEWQNAVAAERSRALAEFGAAHSGGGGGGGSSIGEMLAALQAAGEQPEYPNRRYV